MPRPQGSRNQRYDATRHALAWSVAQHLVDERGAPRSFSGLAEAAGVSVPTLRHYFGDHAGAIAAAFAAAHVESARYDPAAGRPGDEPVEQALAAALEGVVVAWRKFGFGRLLSGGLTVSLGHPELGPAFVQDLLEPLLQGFERLLVAHADALDVPDPRVAALALVGPVVLALLHQHDLDGARCRPLDVPAFVQAHLRGFLHGAARRPG